MSLGAVREEAIERDDAELQNRSLKRADNTMILSTGAIEERPGSFYLETITGSNGIEIEPESGTPYILAQIANGVAIYNSIGNLVISFATATWTVDEDVWILDLGDTVLLGSRISDIHALVYEDGAFTFGLLDWAAGSGGSLSQPYYAFRPDITLTPSALTGSITLTTDVDFFSASYIDERIRYGGREITITAVTDARTASGTVVTELPPTIDITVADTSGFQIGDAVEHATLGGQGIISGIAGSIVTVFVTSFFTGFNGTGANLVGPDAKSNISATTAGTPAGTTLWDEPLISAVRGFPGSAAEHRGRVIFNDFPQAPNVVACSASGTINDFLVGTSDDDAIIDTITASKGVRVLHVLSVEDLLLMTSRGIYYLQTRDGTPFTPDNFLPVRFDNVSASAVRPAKVHDAAIFTAANGENVFAAVLQGDIYKAWSLVPLSDFHNQNINSPVRITATENDSDRPERFGFVINADGTAAVIRWERGAQFQSDSVGIVPWSTSGSYKSIFMAYGRPHSMVERTIGSTTYRFLERFDPTAKLDCATGLPGATTIALNDETDDFVADEDGDILAGEADAASHLIGETVSVWGGDYDFGTATLNSDGMPVDSNGDLLDFNSMSTQIGLSFTMLIEPWSKRSVEGYGTRREAQRIIRLTCMVQDTIRFDMNGEVFGGYRTGEDLTAPPARRTEHAHFYPGDREHYQVLQIRKDRPGPFRLTGMGFKVQL